MKKTIAFITDTHLREKLPVSVNQESNWRKVLADVKSREVNEIVIGGDISDPEYYADFFRSLTESNIPYYAIPGNHDNAQLLSQHFPNPENIESNELYYSFSDENFLYLFLDSSTDEISEPQLHWLKQKLDANKIKVVLFVHHPIFEIDSYVDRHYPLKNRDSVQEKLGDQAQEIFIFCGHYHCEDETGTGAISQYETPAVSYQVRKGTSEIEAHADSFGYRLIYLENGNVRTEVVELKS